MKKKLRAMKRLAKEIKLLCLIDAHFTIDEMNNMNTELFKNIGPEVKEPFLKGKVLYDMFENLTDMILKAVEPEIANSGQDINDYISCEFIPSLHKFNGSKSIN